MNSFINFLISHSSELAKLLGEHIRLTLTAVLIAIVIGIPLGILISSVRGTDKPVLGFANIMQAVPSLAALGLLVPIVGIGSSPAILMVVLYSLLPILKNTYTGLKNINPQTVEAAYGIGMAGYQVLLKVKLPLALPVIMSGVRIAAVTAVGLMTIAAYIGAGGLGNYVISGIQTSNTNLMLCGAIPACILALLMDLVMSKVEKAVVPISLSVDAAKLTKEKIRRRKVRQGVTFAALAVLILAMLSAVIVPKIGKGDRVVISSKPEVEGQIIGNLLADLIEAKTDLEVERNLGLGSTAIIYNAIMSGEIDLYPEYSGSAYAGVYGKTSEPGMTAEEVVEEVRALMDGDGLIFTEVYGFNNRYSLGVLPEFAEKHHLETISDLEPISGRLVLACDQEFPHRSDGIPALQKVYKNLKFSKHLQFQGALMYDAMMTKQVDVMTPFTTDALRLKYDITILEDDKSAFSNYNMATVLSKKIVEAHPELLEVLSLLDNNISDDEMTAMNYDVVVNGKSTAEAAHEFLISKGLI